MAILMDLRIDSEDWQHIPELETLCQRALDAGYSLQEGKEESHVDVLLADDAMLQALNTQWRGMENPTDVLSFPAEVPKEVAPELLGDIAICASVVIAEAKQQQKSLDAHWAHMVIHGCLHLQGYDHVTDVDADNMERLETQLLHSFGYADPYTVNQAL